MSDPEVDRSGPIEADADGFSIGDLVEKAGGDYSFPGEVRAVFVKKSGARRYVVEDDRGLLFIQGRQDAQPQEGVAQGKLH